MDYRTGEDSINNDIKFIQTKKNIKNIIKNVIKNIIKVPMAGEDATTIDRDPTVSTKEASVINKLVNRLINKERWPITTLANNVDALTKNNNGKSSLSRPAFYRALLKKGLT